MANILIWPDISFEPGHFRPVVAIAQKLRTNGHTIRFLCTPECESIMLEYDFDYDLVFGEYYPVGYSTLAAQKPEEARSRIDHCQRIAEGYLESVISSFNPDLLLAGYFISLEALLIRYRHGVPFIITTTFLRHPNDDPGIASIRFLTCHAPEISTKLMNTAVDSDTPIFTGTLESYRSFVTPMEKESKELITCPDLLDYPEAAAQITRQIEPDYPETATAMVSHYIEPSIVEETDVGFDPEGYKVVYATAGSRVRDYLESARRLFKILERMLGVSGMENRYLNLAVGHDLQEDFTNKKRIRIAPGWASQTADLPNAKSAVVHGGLATIKECIYFGVPPIVVPLGKDQMDNAQRVLLHKVGVMVMLDTLDEFKIAKAILDAENDPDIRKNIQKMRDAFVAMEESPQSVAIINQFLADLPG
jgi:UDP:flavonoid glycosyltransferase YjiC (YdhE family)